MGQRRRASQPVLLVRKGRVARSARRPRRTQPGPPKWQVGAPGEGGAAVQRDMVRRGISKPDEHVLVSPLRPSASATPSTAMPSTTADDDASGTTAGDPVSRSRSPASRTSRAACVFVCFTGEGGLARVKRFAAKPVLLEKVVANVNIEMIGRPEEGKRKKALDPPIPASEPATSQRRGDHNCSAVASSSSSSAMAKSASFAQSDNWSPAPEGRSRATTPITR